MNKRVSLALAACCLVLPAANLIASADDEADRAAARRYLAAYKTMEMADWLAERDMTEEAAESYGEALSLFRGLASEHPGWESESVEYRASYCRTRMEKLDVPAEASEEDPGKEDPMETALRLERLSDLEKAVEIYSSVLGRDPSQLQALKGAVRCHLRMGSVPAARDLIRKHIAGPVSDSDLLVLMALVECHYQQFDRAGQMLRLALDGAGAGAEAHVVMGVVLAGQGRLDAAANEMKRALSLDTTISEAYYNLAWISLKQNPGNLAVVHTHYGNALKYGAEPDPLLERLIR